MVTDIRCYVGSKSKKRKILVGQSTASEYKDSFYGLNMIRKTLFGASGYVGADSEIRADYIIADIVKKRFIFIESKKHMDRPYAKTLSTYLSMPIIWRDSSLRTTTDIIKGFQPIKLSYVNRNAVENLLGVQGKHVLEKVITLIQDAAQKEKWPLESIEIRYIRDFEVKDWDYLVVSCVFNSTFEIANEYLEDIYQHLDALLERLSSEERELITNLIYLDIETTKDVSSS